MKNRLIFVAGLVLLIVVAFSAYTMFMPKARLGDAPLTVAGKVKGAPNAPLTLVVYSDFQ